MSIDFPSFCLPSSPSASRLMVIVPAHNEERGIGATLKSLQANREAVVVVVADNCTDRTAEIATSFGVRAIIRDEPRKAGKPYALNYALGILMPEGHQYFAFVDADTVVEPHFSTTLLAEFHRGAQAVQVCYAHKKSNFTVRQRLMDIGFYAANTLRPMGRQYWGLSCGILGNGFALKRELLAAIPFPAGSIVEDLSYHLLLVSNNVKVTYAPGTVVRAEMPSSPTGIRTQRSRWEGGRLNALLSQGLPLLKTAFKPGHARLAEPLLDLLLPPLAIHVVSVSLLFLLPLPYVHAYAWFALAAVAGYCVTTLLMRKEGWKDWAALCAAPLFVLWKLTMVPGILVAAGKSSWKRTERD